MVPGGDVRTTKR